MAGRYPARASLRTTLRAWIVVALAAAMAGPARAQQPPLESDVKAAFLFHFTRFVEWPADRVGQGPFRICAVADPAFAQALDVILKGETAYDRPLVRFDPQTPEEARGCHILYVGSDSDRGMRLVNAVRSAPVLTVGDSPGFLDRGGAIRFLIDDSKVRFDVNLPAASRSGLRVSSRLLRVARHVDKGELQ